MYGGRVRQETHIQHLPTPATVPLPPGLGVCVASTSVFLSLFHFLFLDYFPLLFQLVSLIFFSHFHFLLFLFLYSLSLLFLLRLSYPFSLSLFHLLSLSPPWDTGGSGSSDPRPGSSLPARVFRSCRPFNLEPLCAGYSSPSLTPLTILTLFCLLPFSSWLPIISFFITRAFVLGEMFGLGPRPLTSTYKK